MTPDDRAPDISPADADAYRMLDESLGDAGSQIPPEIEERHSSHGRLNAAPRFTDDPPLVRGPEALRDSIALRVTELHASGLQALESATLQALEEFHVGERQAPPAVGYAVLLVIALVVLAFLVPAVGYLIGDLLIPLWTDAFSWV